LVCSGHFADLWELVLFFFGKNVNVANPKLALYLDYRFQTFRDSASKTPNELDLRNNPVVRQLFAEIIAVLCLSVKRPGTDQVKVRKEDLDLASAGGASFKAPNTEYIKPFFQDGDPLDLNTPMNELCFAIASKDTLKACYWIEWVVLYSRCKTPTPQFAPRGCAPSKRHAGDVIWIVWDILISYCPDGLHKKLADATFNLFRLHYTPGAKERRRFLMYFVVALCCDPVDQQIPIIADKAALDTVIERYPLFYRDIRKFSIRLKEGGAAADVKAPLRA